jgi:hypothetical protein
MRMPRVRFTVRRMMVAVFILGCLAGGLIEGDRAVQRRAVYLDSAYRADWRGERCLSLADAYDAQAKATREWVAAGSTGHPPGETGKESGRTYDVGRREIAYTFGADQAGEWRRRPELATTAAERFVRESSALRERAQELARKSREYERAASFPRVLSAVEPGPPPPE